MATNHEIGRRVRQARKELGMTQQQLGRLWGNKSHAAISDIERGATRVSASGLAGLAEILGKSTSYFYGEGSSAEYFRGGRNEDGTTSKSSASDDFKKFLRSQKTEPSDK